MERLHLLKPRANELRLLTLSAALPIGVHWNGQSWLCGADSGCRLCDLVPRRAVVYFAAALRIHGSSAEPQFGLIERSAAWYHEACRQSGTNWNEVIGQLRIAESSDGRTKVVNSTALQEKTRHPLSSIEQLAFSVAALYRIPRFPMCSTIGQAQRALRAFAADRQELLL